MNLNIATNTKEALLAAEQAITKLFKLQDGVIEALEQAADVLQKMGTKTEAQYGEVHPHLKSLREAIALVDKIIGKEIDAAIGRHDAKSAQPEMPISRPIPDYEDAVRHPEYWMRDPEAEETAAPEGIAPPENRVPAPTAAEQPAPLKEELEAILAKDDSRAGKIITDAALTDYREQMAFKAPQPEPEPLQLDPAPEQEPEPTFQELQAKLLEVARALGNDVVADILAGVDAWRADDVPPWRRAEVIKACDEAIVADESGEGNW